MPNNCEKCGAILNEGAKFCTSCGAKVGDFSNSPQNEINQASNMQNINRQPAQNFQNTQIPAGQPKKSNMKLFGIIAAVIAVVVVIALVLILVLGSGGFGSDEGKFVGTWEYSIVGMSVEYKFNSDNTLEIGSMGYTSEAGTWKVENGKLVLSMDSGMGQSIDAGTYDYSFSNNGNSLTLSMNGVEVLKFNKK